MKKKTRLVLKCELCGKKKKGIPKQFNIYEQNICFDCFGKLIEENEKIFKKLKKP